MTSPTAEVTVTNTISRDTGSLKITKSFDANGSGFAGDFSIGYDCNDGTSNDGTVTLAAGASQTINGIPTGTECTVSEPSTPTPPHRLVLRHPDHQPQQRHRHHRDQPDRRSHRHQHNQP